MVTRYHTRTLFTAHAILFTGRVGKTSIVVRFVRGKYDAHAPSTLQASFLKKQLTVGDEVLSGGCGWFAKCILLLILHAACYAQYLGHRWTRAVPRFGTNLLQRCWCGNCLVDLFAILTVGNFLLVRV